MEKVKIFLEPNTQLLIISKLLLAFEQDFYSRMSECLKLMGSSWKDLCAGARIKSQTIDEWRNNGTGPRSHHLLEKISRFTHIPLHVIRAASILCFTDQDRLKLMDRIVLEKPQR